MAKLKNKDLIKELLLKEREKYLKKIDDIDEDLKELGEDVSDNPPIPITFSNVQGLPKRPSWKHVVLTALKRQNEFLTTDEIAQFALDEFELLSGEKPGTLKSGISNALSNLVKRGQAKNFTNPYAKGYFWGLATWLDNGKIKDQYVGKLFERGVNIPKYEEEDTVAENDKNE